ncbi:Odorant receptor 270 [Nylanderia fulva]|uniref:Odorant receptor n=1 Tax=Nylanderia fulva TaxID=613905 RepID=A0A6G1LQ03_9HYME|nr:Odorant receptor 270 [Nylanderia fulva]
MDFFNNEYYGLTRKLMASIGLWPYQKRERRVVRVFCVTFVLVVAILLQLTTFTTHEYSTSLLIEVFSFTILCIIYVLKYNIVYFNSNQIKKLFDQIQRDWHLIKNTDELKIIQKYANKSRFFTIFSGSIVYPGTFAFISIIFIPDILNIIAPLDEPRQRQFPIHVELFVDSEKYFYLISILIMLAAFLGMTVLMATETMYMIFLQHTCGLFELVSCRLTYAFNKCLLRTTPSKPKCKLCTKLLNVFITHQHCLNFIEAVLCDFSTSYFVLCIFGVASLTLNMFRLLQAVTTHKISEAILTCLFVYAHFCYIFWLNYFGQDLINHSECFFQQIYDTPWYTAPLYAQKLLLITLQRSGKTTNILIGGLFIASFEGFSTLISMALSYTMVIYSTHI